MPNAIVQTKAEMRSIALREVDKPEIGTDEVLVRVHTAGICGSDVGAYLFEESYEWVPTPRVMGHEYSGTVVETGADVTEFEAGDKVVEEPLRSCGQCYQCKSGQQHICEESRITGLHHDGGWQEFIAVPEQNLHSVDDSLDLQFVAIAEPLSVATRAVLENSRLEASDSVLVEGPGPIGLLCAEVARSSGASVAVSGVTSDSHYRLPLARELGFETVNAQESSIHEFVDLFTKGGAIDLVIDATGHRSGVETGTQVVRKGGQIVVVGIPNDAASLQFSTAVRNEIDIQCSYGSQWRNFEQALRLIRQGEIHTDQIIDTSFSVADPEAPLEAFIHGETCKPVFSFA